MGWASEEFETIDLGDKRLNDRAVLLAERLADSPSASIPKACQGWKETQAAYRLITNESVNAEAIAAPHYVCTERRMAAQPVALCIQDTSSLDFNGQDIEDLGPLQYEAQRGMFLHPTYVVTPTREPLGFLDSWRWAREFRDETGERPEDILESDRWIEGYERVAETATTLPDTRCVYVADREADIVSLMRRAAALEHPADWLIRSKHNRTLPQGGKLWASVTAEKSIGEIRFIRAARAGVKSRPVHQQLFVKRVSIPNGLKGEQKGTLEVTCLVAQEIDPPAGEKPVVWRLLTNRLVGSLVEASELIDWYRARWEIEMFFDILKNACKIEKLQLKTMERLEVAITLFMVVAWRINRLMRLGRECPDLDASLVFEQDEWEAAYILNKKEPPKKVPTINEVVRLIARLGGFLGRKGDGEPGAKTIWQGMEQIASFSGGMQFVRSMEIST
jgi:hypothetical protein